MRRSRFLMPLHFVGLIHEYACLALLETRLKLHVVQYLWAPVLCMKGDSLVLPRKSHEASMSANRNLTGSNWVASAPHGT